MSFCAASFLVWSSVIATSWDQRYINKVDPGCCYSVLKWKTQVHDSLYVVRAFNRALLLLVRGVA